MRPAGTRPIALLSAAAFCVSSCLRVTDPMLPQLAHDFRVSTGAASVVVTAFTFAYSLSQLAFGPIGDRFGKYRVLTIAMALSAFAIAAGAAAQSLHQLAALRLLAGVTTAGMLSLALAYVGDAVAVRASAGGAGTRAVGTASGGDHGTGGGRHPDRVRKLARGVPVAGLYLCLRRSPAGAGAACAARGRSRPDGGGAAWPLHGSVCRTACAAPVTQGAAAIFLEGMLFFGMLAYLAAFLRFRFALDYVTIGLLLGCFGLGGLGYGLFARWIVPALGERGMMLTGGVLLLAGLLLLALVAGVGCVGAGHGGARVRPLHGAQHVADERDPTGAARHAARPCRCSTRASSSVRRSGRR